MVKHKVFQVAGITIHPAQSVHRTWYAHTIYPSDRNMKYVPRKKMQQISDIFPQPRTQKELIRKAKKILR
jgi:hypothetical protein